MTVAYYVGGTGTGKTTLMLQHAVAKADERAVPIILIDSEGVIGVDKFNGETALVVDALIDAVWGRGLHARFTPSTQDQVEAVARAAKAAGGIVLAIDEISYWASGAQLGKDLARLYRVHRHSEVDIYATSQYPADISPLVWNVKSEVYIFRNESARAVERLAQECGLSPEDRARVSSLPDMKCIEWKSAGSRAPTPAARPSPPAAAPAEDGAPSPEDPGAL